METGISQATKDSREAYEGDSSKPQTRRNVEEQIFTGIAKRLAITVGAVQADPEKKYGIERFKTLGTTGFEDLELDMLSVVLV